MEFSNGMEVVVAGALVVVVDDPNRKILHVFVHHSQVHLGPSEVPRDSLPSGVS